MTAIFRPAQKWALAPQKSRVEAQKWAVSNRKKALQMENEPFLRIAFKQGLLGNRGNFSGFMGRNEHYNYYSKSLWNADFSTLAHQSFAKLCIILKFLGAKMTKIWQNLANLAKFGKISTYGNPLTYIFIHFDGSGNPPEKQGITPLKSPRLASRKFSISSLNEKTEKNFVMLYRYVSNTIYTFLSTKQGKAEGGYRKSGGLPNFYEVIKIQVRGIPISRCFYSTTTVGNPFCSSYESSLDVRQVKYI